MLTVTPRPGARPPAAEAAGIPATAAVRCRLCGQPLLPLVKGEACASCGAARRTRSLAPIVEDHVLPLLGTAELADKEILGFSMIAAERKLIHARFSRVVSASLYGSYGPNHRDGVDIRAMLEFEAGRFAAVYGIHIFDYFPEHAQALQECRRVLADRGVFFFQLSPDRVRADGSPPTVTREIAASAGYFEYLPPGATLADTSVGADWLVAQMEQAGFDARHLQTVEDGTGLRCHWFVGVKRPEKVGFAERLRNSASGLRSGALSYARTAFPRSRSGVGRQPDRGAHPAAATAMPRPRLELGSRHQALSRTHAIPLPRREPPHLVRVTLSVPPSVPDNGAVHDIHFAEHSVAPDGAETVILLGPDAVYASADLGESWSTVRTDELMPAPAFRSFTTSSGVHLIQGRGWHDPADDALAADRLAPILRFDRDWRFLDIARAGRVHWHGTAAVGEDSGTILFGEYPDNGPAYRHKDPKPHIHPSRVWRSRDDGRSWQEVAVIEGGLVRHLHTCAPDPDRPGRWWVSSGDRSEEVFVWRSDDDGDSWTDVTHPNPAVPLADSFAHHARAVQRFTDLHFDGDYVIWGADDHLGNLAELPSIPDRNRWPGARLYRSLRTGDRLEPEELGWVGLPVRTLVDVGPAWLVMTEAKARTFSLRPRVFILFKDDPATPHHLFDIDNFANRPTGFTYSIASRTARNGVFFTNRNSWEVFDRGPGLLKWQIAFD
ncbi:MAG: hypothetical protein JO267_15825 [Alphaproteobacteria bacterium]|nr:hypothetical protein [Alphaproteobacteria bacterium]